LLLQGYICSLEMLSCLGSHCEVLRDRSRRQRHRASASWCPGSIEVLELADAFHSHNFRSQSVIVWFECTTIEKGIAECYNSRVILLCALFPALRPLQQNEINLKVTSSALTKGRNGTTESNQLRASSRLPPIK